TAGTGLTGVAVVLRLSPAPVAQTAHHQRDRALLRGSATENPTYGVLCERRKCGPHHLLHLPEIQSGMENPHPQPIYTSCLTSACWTKPFCFALICSTIGVAASLCRSFCRSLFCTEQRVCKSCFSLTYSMIPKREQRDWRELARRAANEQDPKKLLEIIEE